LAAIAGSILMASAGASQEAPPNAPEFVKYAKAPGVEVRYLDFRWDEEAFDALMKGGAHPAAQRSWVLARLTLQQEPLRWKGKLVPVGPAILILNPMKGGSPATLEIRYIDMREIFVDMNVIAEPPPGETYQKAPAQFEKANSIAPRLAVAIQEKGRDYELFVHYGNRKTSLTLSRS
jgi:hypothetical protein